MKLKTNRRRQKSCAPQIAEVLEVRSLLSTFVASTTAKFSDPDGGTFSGSGTPRFTWGEAVDGSPPNRFTFQPNNIDVNLGKEFSLGTLSYFNGTTREGTNPSRVSLSVYGQFSKPTAEKVKLLTNNFYITTTTNTQDPDASADVVHLGAAGAVQVQINNKIFELRILGFALPGREQPFSRLLKFRIGEKKSASAELLAELREPFKIIAPQAKVTGFRGAIIGGRFSPSGLDTLSQDHQAKEGALSPDEERRHQRQLAAFLLGETNGNDVAGSPTSREITEIINPVLSRFFRGISGTKPNDPERLVPHAPESALSKLMAKSSEFKTLHDAFKTTVREELSTQARQGYVNFGQLDIAGFLRRNNIEFNKYHLHTTPFTLRAVIGGTQAIKMTQQMASVVPKWNQSGQLYIEYSSTVRYEIFDVFGADSKDKYSTALRSMWQLQHRGKAKPFYHQVIIETTLSGKVAIPREYQTVYVAKK